MTTLFFLGIAAAGFAMTIGFLRHLHWVQRLPSLESIDRGGAHAKRDAGLAGPRVSVVLAARNEEARIETTIRRLLAQRDVELEVVAVDDRSSDRTAEILRRLAAEDGRVKMRRIELLPEGWLGKCHACHVGASAATGDWMLFTDGDVWLQSDVVIRAVRLANSQGVDHVCLTPGVSDATPGGKAWHLAFLLTLSNWLSGVNRDRPGAYLGMGAFNLVRAAAYHACGGYETLRLTVLDDVKLGLLLCRAGKRTRGFVGGDDTACHWTTDVWGMIKIMEKNYFAALDYHLPTALGATVLGGLFCIGAVIGPCMGSLTGIAAGLGLCSICVPAGLLAARLHWSPAVALLVPFVFPVLIFSVLNSTLVTVRQGGVWWRDTFYSLESLRKGNVR
ncbi:MAG: glycosyltransferase family 2 protein [Verrucomicrobiota bacterium]